MHRATATAIVIVLATTSLSWGQEAATQPASRAAPSTQERLNDLVALVEGQNPPEVRRAVARELLLQQRPETANRLTAVLSGTSAPAKVAVATALAELPQYLDSLYIDPLMGMLGDAEADVRAAAARALAAYRDGGVIPRLQKRALDAEQPLRGRLGAIAALGQMTHREAIDGLAEALSDPDEAIVSAALAALQQAAALDFGDDVAAARKWWESTRTLSLEAWQQLQIDRLVQKDREARARLDAIEARLVKVLETNFQRAPDAERLTLLASYLSDSATPIRLLGLRLTQLHLSEGKAAESLPTELTARVRDLMKSAEPREQAAAVRTVASFRRPQDAEQFLSMLASARNRGVRLALINGLGYVGNGTAADALLDILEDADEETATEAVAALGRLAERGALPDDKRPALALALLRVFSGTQPAQVALRERVLWAMGNVADASFGPALATALDPAEAVAVRQAAARGLAALKDPKQADALAGATSDADPVVRKTAVETLANLGSTDKHLLALWGRLTSPPETDESIRQAAWRGALTLLSKRSALDIEEWLNRVPGEGRTKAQRVLELLQRQLKLVQDAHTPDRSRSGAIHARIATQYGLLEQPAEAIGEYVKALADLRGERPDLYQKVALELLRFALASGRYDQSVAAVLVEESPGPDPDAVWQAVRTEVELRLTRERVDQALAILDAVEKNPPGVWPPGAADGLKQLRERAQQVKQRSSTDSNGQPGSSPSPGG